MKGALSLSTLFAVLSSKAGYVGDNTAKKEGMSFPYATQEVKQQIAENLYGVTETIPEDYFEVYVEYIETAGLLVRHGLSIFGENAEQQVFWFYVTSIRSLMTLPICTYSSEEKQFIIDAMDSLENRIRKWTGEDEAWRKIVSSAISYEEAHPYNPYKKVELKRERLKKIVERVDAATSGISFEELLTGVLHEGIISWEELQELVMKEWKMSEEAFSKMSPAEFKEQMKKEVAAVKNVPEIFPQLRERILQGLKQVVEPKTGDLNLKENTEHKKAEE